MNRLLTSFFAYYKRFADVFNICLQLAKLEIFFYMQGRKRFICLLVSRRKKVILLFGVSLWLPV